MIVAVSITIATTMHVDISRGVQKMPLIKCVANQVFQLSYILIQLMVGHLVVLDISALIYLQELVVGGIDAKATFVAKMGYV